MPGRLLEAGPERSAKLKATLKERCDHLLVYVYGDWLTLQERVRKVGILLLDSNVKATAVSLAIIE
jgi:hypothetical protein